jgi:hypothetical protein
MDAYYPVQRACPPPLRSADIAHLFGKQPRWFDRDRVRKRLYAKGFPHPLDRGLWSADAVLTWLATIGANPQHAPPASVRRNQSMRKRRPNGYAPATRSV